MHMPTLQDIFDEFRLANDISCDVREAKSALLSKLDVLELEGLKLGYNAREDIETAAGYAIEKAQFHGFVQGFCFARELFGGRFE